VVLDLDGAAVHRCNNRIILRKALAAEGALFASEMIFSEAC
jgi:hypothetical protein